MFPNKQATILYCTILYCSLLLRHKLACSGCVWIIKQWQHSVLFYCDSCDCIIVPQYWVALKSKPCPQKQLTRMEWICPRKTGSFHACVIAVGTLGCYSLGWLLQILLQRGRHWSVLDYYNCPSWWFFFPPLSAISSPWEIVLIFGVYSGFTYTLVHALC